jgi:hypothetical protein
MLPIDYMRCNLYNKHVNKRYGAAKRQKGNEMKLFMTKKEKLAKMEALNAKYEALSKEYRETVKKAQEIEATKGEKFSWSYFQRAETILEQITKLRKQITKLSW